MTPDSHDYMALASSLYFNHRFELPVGVPERTRTPGFPAFIAALSLNIRRVVWAQVILGALTCGFVYLATRMLWYEEAPAVFAGILMAADPVTILHGGVILTETLYVFCFMAAFVSLLQALEIACFAQNRAAVESERKKRAIPNPSCARTEIMQTEQLNAFKIDQYPVNRSQMPQVQFWHFLNAGLFFGLAALVRPVGVLYAPFAAAVCLLDKQRHRLIFLFLFALVSMIPPGLWVVRNEYTHVTTFSREEKIQPAVIGNNLRRPFDYAGRIGGNLVSVFGGHGMEMAAWMVLRDPAYNPMRPALTGKFSGTLGLMRRHIALGAMIVFYLYGLAVIYFLAIFGAVSARYTHGFAPVALVLSPIAYHVVLNVCLTHCYYRQRVPVMPFIFILAARGMFP